MNDRNKSAGDTAIDHKARSMAQRALDRQDAHEKFCEERMRHAEIFENDLKHSVARIHKKMDDTEKTRTDQRLIEAKEQTKVQTRQNIMWAGLTFTLVFGLKYFVE